MPPLGAPGAPVSRIPVPRASVESAKPGIGSGLYVADGPGLELVAPKVPTSFEVRNTSGAAVKVSSGSAAHGAADHPPWSTCSDPFPSRCSSCRTALTCPSAQMQDLPRKSIMLPDMVLAHTV